MQQFVSRFSGCLAAGMPPARAFPQKMQLYFPKTRAISDFFLRKNAT
jgi:hypothetical protein